MFKQNIGLSVISLLIAIAFCGMAIGGDDTKDKTDPAKIYERLPKAFTQQYAVLGARVKTAGKQMTLYEGAFSDAAGNAWKARVIVQLPGMVKLEGFNNPKAVLAFDRENAKASYSRSDEALLEMFLMRGMGTDTAKCCNSERKPRSEVFQMGLGLKKVGYLLVLSN